MIIRRRNRRGLAMIPALVCLAVAALLCGVMLKQVYMHRVLVQDEEGRMQAEWLAQSALARASAKLRLDKNYKGETWDVPAAALGRGAEGTVKIRVETVAKEPGKRLVRVVADYPKAEERRARQSLQITVNLGPENSGGSL